MDLHNQLQRILCASVDEGLPGVIACVCNRDKNLSFCALGKRAINGNQAMSPDTVVAFFSITKLFTAIALMQCLEEGLVCLDDEVSQYVKEIEKIQYLIGFEHNKPQTQKPNQAITIRQLLLHTAGFGYEFLDQNDLAYRQYHQIPSVMSNSFASIQSALVHHPGSTWVYGVSMDWVGKIIECVRAKRLYEVIKERIFLPCGIVDMAFDLNQDMQQRRAIWHSRKQDGRLLARPNWAFPNPCAMDMGGHGLQGSVGEFMKCIRMILNNGMGPFGRVIKPQTLKLMQELCMPISLAWDSSMPSYVRNCELFAERKKAFGCGFLRFEDEGLPPKGSWMWFGLANVYFFIDLERKIGACYATQIFPFFDEVAYRGFLAFVRTIYETQSHH